MTDRKTWDSRYAARGLEPVRPPSPFLVRCRPLLPPGRALDVACGDGRNAVYLARHGWTVDAIDHSHAALARLLSRAQEEALPIRPVQADLETFRLPRRTYAVVCNVRYLQRSLFDDLADALAPGGVLVFETFLRDQALIGHPRNPAFLLAPGELQVRFAALRTEIDEEGLCEDEDPPAYLARLAARRVAVD